MVLEVVAVVVEVANGIVLVPVLPIVQSSKESFNVELLLSLLRVQVRDGIIQMFDADFAFVSQFAKREAKLRAATSIPNRRKVPELAVVRLEVVHVIW